MNTQTITTTNNTAPADDWDAVEATFYKNLYYRIWSDYLLKRFGKVKKYEPIEEVDPELDADDLEFWKSKCAGLREQYNRHLKGL